MTHPAISIPHCYPTTLGMTLFISTTNIPAAKFNGHFFLYKTWPLRSICCC